MRAFIHFFMGGSDFCPRVHAVQMRLGDAQVGKQWPQFFTQALSDGGFFGIVTPAHGGTGDMGAFNGDFE